MKSIRNGCIHPRLDAFSPAVVPLVLSALLLAGCGPNRGPEYGADPVEREALAIPPDLAAEPLAAQNPYPNLPDISQFRPGPRPAEREGQWAAQVNGNTLNTGVPAGWALGTVRAALLMQGAAIAEERTGVLRTAWLGSEALGSLGVPAPESGNIRFTVKSRGLSGGGSRVVVQGAHREDDNVRAVADKVLQEFLRAVQPAFGKRR
ncbi:hypothetical protein [Thiohalorhabdus methylotrophus]|uniref:DUF4410 domain-containing protein n=1 Tax=Thiohalorhabdus methylotrophus TaxID=3242694 RepID=A0ABV4TTD9_9GAMM